MPHCIQVGTPEKYVWFPIDKLSVELKFEYNGEEYVVRMRINNRYLRCQDYGHSVLFDNLITKANVYKENKKVATLTLNIKHCFDVDLDEGDIFFDEERFIKEVKTMYKVISKEDK